MDFFEKILPAMCLCEVTGYMDGMDFHDDMMSIFFNTRRIRKSLKIGKLILSIKDGQATVEDKVFDSMLRRSQYGDLVYVDKGFHRSYLDNENTDMYIFIFDIRKVYERIRKDLDISFVEFHESVRQSDGYVSYDNAVKNWRMGSDKSMSAFSAYKEYIGGSKDDFCAIRMSKNSIFSM
jgi:hypothetical protein